MIQQVFIIIQNSIMNIENSYKRKIRPCHTVSFDDASFYKQHALTIMLFQKKFKLLMLCFALAFHAIAQTDLSSLKGMKFRFIGPEGNRAIAVDVGTRCLPQQLRHIGGDDQCIGYIDTAAVVCGADNQLFQWIGRCTRSGDQDGAKADRKARSEHESLQLCVV